MTRVICQISSVLLTVLGVQAIQTARITIKDQHRPPSLSTIKGSVPTIADIGLVGDSLLLLENETNSLILVSADQRVIASIKNTGAGSAMLVNPIQMSVAGPNEVIVLDSDEPKITRFVVRPAAITFTSSIILKGITSVGGICRLADKTLVLGRTAPENQGKLLHSIAKDGAVVSSFGDHFGPPDEFAQLFHGTGILSCSPQERLVFVASRFLPTIRSFDDRGVLRWTQTLPDFRAVTYKETSPGNFIYVYPPDNVWDSVLSVFRASPGLVAVQVGRRNSKDATKATLVVRTVLYEMKSGRLVSTQTDLPQIKAAAGGRLLAQDPKRGQILLSYITEER